MSKNILDEIEFSHFEDKDGKKYHLNDYDSDMGEILFMFSNGKIKFYIDVEFGFDIDLKLIPK